MPYFELILINFSVCILRKTKLRNFNSGVRKLGYQPIHLLHHCEIQKSSTVNNQAIFNSVTSAKSIYEYLGVPQGQELHLLL